MKKESLKRQAMITACCGALVRAMGFGLRLWISRLLGGGDRNSVRRVSAFCFYVAILTGIAVAAPLLPV